MEDIKTDIQKIMESFNDSGSHKASKKLSFGFLNDTTDDTFTRKY